MSRRIDQADDLGTLLGIAIGGGNVGHQFERVGVEYLDSARLVVGNRDQASILRNRTADAVTRLQGASNQLTAQNIKLAQAAVAAKYVAVTGVA